MFGSNFLTISFNLVLPARSSICYVLLNHTLFHIIAFGHTYSDVSTVISHPTLMPRNLNEINMINMIEVSILGQRQMVESEAEVSSNPSI